jgi:RNA polymerase sigma factor FliA
MTAIKTYSEHMTNKQVDELVESHILLVRKVVSSLKVYLPNDIGEDDLYSLGCWGLIEAAKKFNPSKKVSFTSFAYLRIKGAIIDEIRRNSFGGQSMVKKQQEIINATRRALQKKQAMVNDKDVAQELDMSISDYLDLLAEVSTIKVYNIIDGDKDLSVENKVEKDIEDQENASQLSLAIEQLSEKEKLIVSLYYDKGMSLKEIGRILGVSESRICQLHKKAIFFIRAYLQSDKNSA